MASTNFVCDIRSSVCAVISCVYDLSSSVNVTSLFCHVPTYVHPTYMTVVIITAVNRAGYVVTC